MIDHDDIEPPHAASATDLVLSELQLFGYRPFDDQADPRPLPEGKMIAGAVADIFDALVATLSDTRSDEWSGRRPISPSVKLLAANEDPQLQSRILEPSRAVPTDALKNKVRDQNGGLRREPELHQQEEVVLTPPLAEYEFDAAPDDGDADAVQATALSRSMQGLARVVSLDPDDKMVSER